MSRNDKLLWVGFGVVCAGVIALCLTSCSAVPPAKRAQAVSCLDIANAALQDVHTCDEARAAIAKALENAPQCLSIFGLHVNMENVDGGEVVRCDD